MNFPVGLDLCPNDGEPLLANSRHDSGFQRSDNGPLGLIDPTEPIEIGSIAAEGDPAYEPTASMMSVKARSSTDDLTRAARPGARKHRAQTPDTAIVAAPRDRRADRKASAKAQLEERVGQVLGNYKLLSVLGRGGMGCVYLAEHVKLGRRVALKLLRDDYAQRRDAVARFFQEARAVNRIRHRNIVDVTDFVELDGGITFLVMEFLDGGNLGRVLHTQELSVPRAMALLIQICDGLAAAHKVGVVHRDLKPDNIFVVPTSDGAELVKLLDFGVAKLMWHEEDDDYGFETAAGAVVGTPTYMSPEQAGGMEIDPRADIYSLGAIMYEIFTGRPLFRAKSFGEFVRKHLNQQPTPPSQTEGGRHIHSKLEATILRCLEKAPEARFQDISELRDQLMHLLGAVETSLPVSLPGQPRGNPTQAASGGPRVGVATADAASRADREPRRLPLRAPHPSQVGASASTAGAELLGSADLMPFSSALSGESSDRVVPDTAMSMGDLPARRTVLRAPGHTLVWLVLGLLAVSGAALAFLAISDSGDADDTGVTPTRAAAGPVVTPMPDEVPAPTPTPSRSFTVRFLSTPSAQVIELASGDTRCSTPCDLTVDPDGPGPAEYRDYELRQAGYYARTVRIDLAARPRSVHPQLQQKPQQTAKKSPSSRKSRSKRARKAKRSKRARKGKRSKRARKAPITDKDESAVVQPDPVTPKRRPEGRIDPTETLDSFDKP